MVRLGPEDVELDDGERLLRTSETAHSGWEQTLADVESMARDRAEDGFETLVLAADDTTPKPPGEDDEWGFVYIVGSDRAAEFRSFTDGTSFGETIVYQAESAGHVFLVTECLDTDADRALFLAGTYRMQRAPPLVEAALEAGEMYSHLKKLDGTLLGTIKHDDAEQFFPDPDRFGAFDARSTGPER